jgi:hypothetical protein
MRKILGYENIKVTKELPSEINGKLKILIQDSYLLHPTSEKAILCAKDTDTM